MADWANAADVLTYTGVTVTTDEVLRAQFLIELFAGTTTDASDQGLIRSRNLRLLKMATVYQTAWMSQHPDVFTNVDVTNFSQDGMSATQGHVNAALLAPLAKRCVDRLTWMLAPWRARKPLATMLAETGSRDSVAYDDNKPWAPL